MARPCLCEFICLRDSGCPPRNIDGLEDMGAKYLPTIKDMKASQRFQQKQKPVAQPRNWPAINPRRSQETVTSHELSK